MAVANAKILCLCLLGVAVSVGAYSGVQTLPAKLPPKGGHGVQTLPGNLGGGGGGFGGGGFGGGGAGGGFGVPSHGPQVQPKPGRYDGIPGNNLKPLGRPVGRPVGSSTRPFNRPPHSGSLTRPRPRPSKGGNRYQRSANFYDSEESDEERYRRSADSESEESGEERYRRQAEDEEYEDDEDDEDLADY